MSSNLTSMQIAMINAGLLTEQRATIVNTIEKDKRRKAEKRQKQQASKNVIANFRAGLNQNRKAA